MIIRYVILSPSEEARQAFLGSLFGKFDLSPKGRGERVTLHLDRGDLEIVGTGIAGKLQDMTVRLLEGGVQVDGILFLIQAGDDSSVNEAKSITHWIHSSRWHVAVKTWVFNSLDDLNRETTRRNLLTLVSENRNLLDS